MLTLADTRASAAARLADDLAALGTLAALDNAWKLIPFCAANTDIGAAALLLGLTDSHQLYIPWGHELADQFADALTETGLLLHDPAPVTARLLSTAVAKDAAAETAELQSRRARLADRKSEAAVTAARHRKTAATLRAAADYLAALTGSPA